MVSAIFLGALFALSLLIYRKLVFMSQALDTLTASVTAETTVVASAITLLNGLKAQLDAAGTDPAKLADLSAQLDASRTALAAAIVANTPAAPPATP